MLISSANQSKQTENRNETKEKKMMMTEGGVRENVSHEKVSGHMSHPYRRRCIISQQPNS